MSMHLAHTLRWIIPILVPLALVIWVGATVELTNLSMPADSVQGGQLDDKTGDWRQTSQGWQRVSSWTFEENESQAFFGAQIHPLVIGMLELLISFGALLAYSPGKRRLVV